MQASIFRLPTEFLIYHLNSSDLVTVVRRGLFHNVFTVVWEELGTDQSGVSAHRKWEQAKAK